MAERKPIADQPGGGSTGEIRIRRGKVASVDLYEIKDSELDILEKGSPADIQFNFSIFLLSTAVSFFIALLTTKIENNTTKTVFIFITIIGFFFGVYLLIQWRRNRTSLRELCQKIRDRIPPEKENETVTEHPEVSPPKD